MSDYSIYSYILAVVIVVVLYVLLFGVYSTPAPNLCPEQLKKCRGDLDVCGGDVDVCRALNPYSWQLKSCEQKLDNLTRWDISDDGVLENLVATHQNKSYVCLNWTEMPYRIGGEQ